MPKKMNRAEPDHSRLIAALRQAGLIGPTDPVLRPLAGGVSSELFLVEEPGRPLVVKRALAKLRVRDDWYADVSRNRVEQAYLRLVSGLMPQSVPRVLFSHPADGWFAMEFLDGTFANWKTLLLQNQAEAAHARRAGEILGRIHRATWGDPAVARAFATLENFRQLRLEPYLETTARRVPDLAALLRAEQERLSRTALALVHGDFSPKNILISPGRFVLLDAEVGWFGDPVFDTAFLLTHLHLKGLVHSADPGPLLALIPAFWAAYAAALGARADADLERRIVRLLLCLLLARMHGKSPVEYLPDPVQREFVTEFVRTHLPRPPERIAEITTAWHAALRRR